jgi:hypothetical protein
LDQFDYGWSSCIPSFVSNNRAQEVDHGSSHGQRVWRDQREIKPEAKGLVSASVRHGSYRISEVAGRLVVQNLKLFGADAFEYRCSKSDSQVACHSVCFVHTVADH